MLPHPGYAEVYPNNTTAIDARRRLNIENDNFVVTFFGGIRPNKGLDGLITAFSQIDDPKALLLIAGRPWPPEEYVKKIRHLVGSDDRILLRTIEVPDTEVQIYLKASDVVVFPFKQVLTSGSTLLAMSFGRPVIVPKIGCLPELVDAGAGIVYDPTDPVGLLSALRDARQCDLAEMGRIAYTQSQRASWRDLAYQTAAVYRGEDV